MISIEKIQSFDLVEARKQAIKLISTSANESFALVLVMGRMYALLKGRFSDVRDQLLEEWRALCDRILEDYRKESAQNPATPAPVLPPRPIYAPAGGERGAISVAQAQKYCRAGAMLLALQHNGASASIQQLQTLYLQLGIEALAAIATRTPVPSTVQEVYDLHASLEKVAREHGLKVSEITNTKAFRTGEPIERCVESAKLARVARREKQKLSAERNALAVLATDHIVIEKDASLETFARVFLERVLQETQDVTSALNVSINLIERAVREIREQQVQLEKALSQAELVAA